MSGTRRSAQGFTLVELAVVLLIATLLLGGILAPLASQFEQKRIADTQRLLDEIRESLIGFAAANGRLPCPDQDGNGTEDRTVVASGDGCAAGVYEGALPWATLGVGAADSTGNRFRYRVSNQFTRLRSDPNAAGCTPICTLEIGDNGDITIQTRADNPATPGVETKFVVNLATVPAVVISFGADGFGAISTAGIAQPAPPPINADETTNATPGAIKISRTKTPQQQPCDDTVEGSVFCEFDDQLIWIPTALLFNRMVAAGRLP